VRSWLFVLVACGGSSSTSSPDTTASVFARDDADAIVARVRERYASAKTYADEGTFRSVYRETDGREKRTLQAVSPRGGAHPIGCSSS
jgi:hypothetical protein